MRHPPLHAANQADWSIRDSTPVVCCQQRRFAQGARYDASGPTHDDRVVI